MEYFSESIWNNLLLLGYSILTTVVPLTRQSAQKIQDIRKQRKIPEKVLLFVCGENGKEVK